MVEVQDCVKWGAENQDRAEAVVLELVFSGIAYSIQFNAQGLERLITTYSRQSFKSQKQSLTASSVPARIAATAMPETDGRFGASPINSRAPGIEVNGADVTIHGYQEFKVSRQKIKALKIDPPLQRKRN